jgi:REP element-mobilizing transposase RayT
MPRIARGSLGGVFVHVINRGNGRRPVFHEEDDYGGFGELLGEAGERTAVPLAGLCLVPNHLEVACPRYRSLYGNNPASLSPISLRGREKRT